MRKNLLVSLGVSLLLFSNASGQETVVGQRCAGQGVATHRFRQLGEKIEIPLRGEGVPTSVADCDPVSLELHWANGRNNGSNFNVTFLDGDNRPIFAKQISAFLTGVIQFPLASFDTQPTYGASLAMISVPTRVTIQAVGPFAAPAGLSYAVTRVARQVAAAGDSRLPEESENGNEIVSIHNSVRLIGATRLPLVQIELKASRPFPVRDVPLQLQIGKRVFSDELSGDYTGRRLTLSLTTEMFSELHEGDEIVAFFRKSDGNASANQEVWSFGKLVKPVTIKP